MPNALILAAVVTLAIGCSDGAPNAVPTTTTTAAVVDSSQRVAVFGPPGLDDDVLVLGAPFGVEDRGVLLRIDLSTRDVWREVTDGSGWPAGFKEPTTDAAHPDAEAASRSPDGRHLAVFTRSGATRLTGIRIYRDGADTAPLHRLQSVATVVGGRLAWSPRSDAVYLLAATVDGQADRVIGIPVGGRPYTVVRLDERGFTWLAVE